VNALTSILLIGDSSDVLGILREVLTEEGYQVLEAADGREGVSLYREHRPSVTIVDIMMPDNDRVEMVKEILTVHPKAVIFTLSGQDEDYQEVAKSLGASRGFRKPIPLEELFAGIRTTSAFPPSERPHAAFPSEEREARSAFRALLEQIPAEDAVVLREMVTEVSVTMQIELDLAEEGIHACFVPYHTGDETRSWGPILISDEFFRPSNYGERRLLGLIAHEAAHAVLLRKLGPIRSRADDSEELANQLARTWGLQREIDALNQGEEPEW